MTRSFVIVIAPVGDVDDVLFVLVGAQIVVWTSLVGDGRPPGTTVDM